MGVGGGVGGMFCLYPKHGTFLEPGCVKRQVSNGRSKYQS